jgi:hypothetical protein
MAQQVDQHVGPKKHEGQLLQALIGDRVLHALGHPGNLHRVQVRRLWGDHFRVNVFVGVDAASALVAHSFFLVADDGGNILRTVPALTRKY